MAERIQTAIVNHVKYCLHAFRTYVTESMQTEFFLPTSESAPHQGASGLHHHGDYLQRAVINRQGSMYIHKPASFLCSGCSFYSSAAAGFTAGLPQRIEPRQGNGHLYRSRSLSSEGRCPLCKHLDPCIGRGTGKPSRMLVSRFPSDFRTRPLLCFSFSKGGCYK